MKNNFIKCLSFLIILFIGILFLIASASTPKQTAAPLTKSVRKPSLVPVEEKDRGRILIINYSPFFL